MIQTSATLLAIAGAAFVVAGYAPAALEARAAFFQDRAGIVASADSRSPAPRDRTPLAVSATGKGDRLNPPRPAARERSTVAVVEIVGLSQAAVVLRERGGTVLYRSDPMSNTTVVAKDADLPMVTLKEAPSAPASQPAPSEPSSVQGLSPKQDGRDAPNAGEKRPRTIGCEAALSPLARGDAQRTPSRCLAQASAALAS